MDTGSLSGIQLIFTNDVQTPLYETEQAEKQNWKLKTIDVDT